MYRKSSSFLKHYDFMIIDIIMLEIALIISYIYRNGYSFRNEEFKHLYISVGEFLIIISVVVTMFINSYKNIIKRGYYVELLETIKHSAVVTAALVLYLFLTKNADMYSRKILLFTWALEIIFSYIMRVIWKTLLRKNIIHIPTKIKTIIVITSSDKVERVLQNFHSKLNDKNGINILATEYKIVGFIICDKDMTGESISGVPVVTNKKNTLEYICRSWVDETFICLDNTVYAEWEERVVAGCTMMGLTVHQDITSILKQTDTIKHVEMLGSYTVMSSSLKTVTVAQMAIKRVMDILGALVGLIFTAILYIFIAPIIYIKSPGPIIFKQWRVGRNGKKFQIYKFRSMYLDAEERKKELMAQNKIKDGMMFKMDNDPRIIGGENGKGIGNFIRNTSIDEFPQFLNVLKGDMSLVGTRPPTVDEWEKYELHHRARLAIKPGLTGMWQVSGRSTITDFEEVVNLDTNYIMNWSIGKDIKIILKTIWVVIRREGSS